MHIEFVSKQRVSPLLNTGFITSLINICNYFYVAAANNYSKVNVEHKG